MSGELAKKEMETSDKPTTSHGKASSEESRNKERRKEKKKVKKTSSHIILVPLDILHYFPFH